MAIDVSTDTTRTAAAKPPAASAAQAAAGSGTAASTASGKDDQQQFSFWDLVDIVNPLQHIPIVNSIYRAVTGDTIKPTSEILGGCLYGGVVGMAASVVSAICEQETGHDPGGALIAMVVGDDKAGKGGGAGDKSAPVAVASAAAPAVAGAAVAGAAAAGARQAPAAQTAPLAAQAAAQAAAAMSVPGAAAGPVQLAEARTAAQPAGQPAQAPAPARAFADTRSRFFPVPARNRSLGGQSVALAQKPELAQARQMARQRAGLPALTPLAAQIPLQSGGDAAMAGVPTATRALAQPQPQAQAQPLVPGQAAAPAVPPAVANPAGTSPGTASAGGATPPAVLPNGPVPVPRGMIADAMMNALNKYEKSMRLGAAQPAQQHL